MILSTWAEKHGVPSAALFELQCLLGAVLGNIPKPPAGNKLEAAVQQRIRMAEAKQGNYLWRNNNGATYDQDGRLMRFGLANDSVAISKKFKSSDLIGITPHTVVPEDVGRRHGIFTSIEVKREGWRYRSTEDKEVAQYAWIQLITSLGGIGKFSTGAEYQEAE